MRPIGSTRTISKEQEDILVAEMIAFSLRVMKKDVETQAGELAILPLVLGLLFDR